MRNLSNHSPFGASSRWSSLEIHRNEVYPMASGTRSVPAEQELPAEGNFLERSRNAVSAGAFGLAVVEGACAFLVVASGLSMPSAIVSLFGASASSALHAAG